MLPVARRRYVPVSAVVPGTRFLHLGRVVTAAARPLYLGLRPGSSVLLTDGRTITIDASRVALADDDA